LYLQNIAFPLQRPSDTLRYYRSHFIFAALQVDWRTEKNVKDLPQQPSALNFPCGKITGKYLRQLSLQQVLAILILLR